MIQLWKRWNSLRPDWCILVCFMCNSCFTQKYGAYQEGRCFQGLILKQTVPFVQYVCLDVKILYFKITKKLVKLAVSWHKWEQYREPNLFWGGMHCKKLENHCCRWPEFNQWCFSWVGLLCSLVFTCLQCTTLSCDANLSKQCGCMYFLSLFLQILKVNTLIYKLILFLGHHRGHDPSCWTSRKGCPWNPKDEDSVWTPAVLC